jgi:hypothetical protein
MLVLFNLQALPSMSYAAVATARLVYIPYESNDSSGRVNYPG